MRPLSAVLLAFAVAYGASAATPASAPPVYFVGLDGADWQLLDEFIADGSMPNLARLVAEGSSGILQTEVPAMSPILWTTMMTGVSPLEHRVLDFTRFSAADGAREPIGSDDRRSPAVWNIASWAGKRVGVLGLWATFPAEAVNGVVVSDRLSSFLGPPGAAPAGAVFPASWEPVAAAARERVEREVGLDELRALLPDLTAAEVESARQTPNPYAGPVPGLRRLVVETRLQDAIFRELVAREKPDLAILYLEATDVAGHLFASYFPPRLPNTSAADFARFQGLPRAVYRWIDTLLGGYATLAKERGAILFLASDHGFQWREGRPKRTTGFSTATAAYWHRKEGMYVLHGPGIPARPRLAEPAGIRRVAATLLALSGLEPGSAMTGPPLAPVPASNVAPVDYSRRFRDELRARKSPPPAKSAAGSAEEIAKLQALGYLGTSEAERAPAGNLHETRSPGSYNNEGLILRDEKKTDDAIRAFERAVALDPTFASAEWNLSETLFRKGEHDRADRILLSALSHGLGAGEGGVARRVDARLKIGRTALDSGDCAGALKHFQAAERLPARDATAPAAAGLAYLCLRDGKSAAAAFRRSLAINPNQPQLATTVRRLEAQPPQ